MPCAFQFPQVMVLHAALCLQEVQRQAGSLPYVLAGDFNFKPEDPMYALYQTGTIAKDDPAYPELPAADKWTPTLAHPVQSAYRAVNGTEPEFTNYCISGGNKTLFKATLDYCFFRGLDAQAVLPLPSSEDFAAVVSLPNEDEPSDHIKIGATFSFPTSASEENA
jgi:hypothetical protein